MNSQESQEIEFAYCRYCHKTVEVYKSVFGDYCIYCMRGVELTNEGKFYWSVER